MLELLVNIYELTQAAAKMNAALANYREAVGNVQTAANDLATKWEGEGQVAFVADQAQAYKWYISLADIVEAMIDQAKRVAERYEDNIQNLTNIMKA